MTPVQRFARLVACAVALPLALAGCKGDQKPAQKGNPAGEILPGSASDAMLPYDSVRSQPPLAPPPSGKPGAKASGGGKADEPDDASEQPADEAAPADAQPAPEPAREDG